MTQSKHLKLTPIQVAQSFMEAWDTGDLERMEQIVHDQCVFRVSVGDEPGKTVEGKQAVLANVEEMITTETETESGFGRLWHIDGHVFGEWFYDEYLPDGRRITHRGLDRLHIQDNQILEIDAFRKAFE